VTYEKQFEGSGTVLGNAYIFGRIDQFERVAYKVDIDYGGDPFIAYGETKTLTCRLVDGYGQEAEVTAWEIHRNYGTQTADDIAWDNRHLDFDGVVDISYTAEVNDLGGASALFLVVAHYGDGQEAARVVEV